MGMQSLLGCPVYNSESMGALTVAAKTILFANWEFYTIVERKNLAIQRLNELYAGTSQIGFVAKFRVGGAPTQTEAFKHLLMPASA